MSSRLIINCGSSGITVAVLSAQSGRLQIEKFVSEPLHCDCLKDKEWLAAVGVALKKLVQAHKISGKATFIIPGSQILTKIIKIPKVEAARRTQTIVFEAQQKIPYSVNELVWDSQIIGDDGVEMEVLFIACKADTIKEFSNAVTAAGLTFEAIRAATVLDYNALEFAYSDLNEDALVINMGACSTNFLFRDADGLFARNIALGGNTLTQNIAESLNKSFPQAEAIKCNAFNGEAVPVDGATTDTNKEALESCADAFMRRLGQEITRSIVHYKRQKKAPGPLRILLTGRGARLQGFAEYLRATQNSEVEYLDPLQGVTSGNGVTHDPEALRLEVSEIVGEACGGFLSKAVTVNLLPKETQTEIRFAAKKPFFILSAACLALAPWPAFLGFKGIVSAHREQAEQVRNQVEPFLTDQAKIEQNMQRALAISKSIQRVEGLVESKSNWIQFFAELQDSLTQAEDVWLDDLKVDRRQTAGDGPSYSVVLNGQMLVREIDAGIDRQLLTSRIKMLQSSFETSVFVTGSQLSSIKWTKLNEGLNVLPFTINLAVNTAKSL